VTNASEIGRLTPLDTFCLSDRESVETVKLKPSNVKLVSKLGGQCRLSMEAIKRAWRVWVPRPQLPAHRVSSSQFFGGGSQAAGGKAKAKV
jgi:hypothetical protein